MIRVTVELISARGPQHNKVLGIAAIVNDRVETVASGGSRGDYNVKLSQVGGCRPWKSGRVEGFPRKRLGGWDLLFRALKNTVGDRNKIS